MRVLVFLLVLANLLFYAYGAGYFGRPENPDADRIDRQVSPEKIRVVSRGEAPAVKEAPAAEPAAEKPADAAPEAAPESKPAASEPVAPPPAKETPAPVANACLRWENLSIGEADQLEKLVRDKAPTFKSTRQAIAGEGATWWVHIPPLPGKPEAEKKAAELRRLGVTDYFIMTEAGANRYAISLGIFSSERGSEDRLAELKGAGVRSAKVVMRPGKDGHVNLEANGPVTFKAPLSDAVAAVLPKVAARNCP